MGKYFKFTVTPTTDLTQFASGDYMGKFAVKTGAADTDSAKLKAVTIVDNAAQSGDFKLIFFSQEPTIASAVNAALDLTDANAAYYLGHVAVASTDYVTSASNVMAMVKDINLDGLAASDENGEIYCVMESAGTPDYAAADDLTLTFTFELD